MIFVRDRVKQGTTTNGAGTISLTSSFGGFQNFSVLGNNSETFYAIEESTNWEVGIGTYSGTTLTRDTVLDSASGAGVPIYLSGSAVVFVTYPASGSVFSTGSIALATGINVGASGITVTAGGDINLDQDQKIYFESDKGTWIETDSEDRLRFVVGGNQMLLLDEDDDRVNIGFGNKLAVGLGNNTSPAYDLDVSGVGNFSSGIRVSGITFLEDGGKEQRIAYTPTSGAKIDSNTTGIYSTSGNLVSTGNVLHSRISTIESTGVATAANLASTGDTVIANLVSTGNAVQTGVFTTSGNLNTRISTVESSGAVTGLGSAPSTNIKKLALWDATDGLTFDTNLTFNTSIDELVLGVSGVRFADASNQNTAFENWSLIVSNPDKEYYNYVTAGSNTIGSGAGVDFSGVNGIYTTGQLISSKRHKVTISGVAGSTSQVGVLQLQDSVDTSTTKAVTPNAVRVVSGDLQSQIAGGGTTYTAGSGLTLVGTEFNTTGTGHFDRITFTDNNIQIGDAGSSNTGNSKVIEIGYHAGSSNDNNTDTIFLGRNSAAGGGSGNDNAIFIGTNAGYVGLDADYSVFVGYDAGNSTSGTAYSNLIGYQAGKQTAITGGGPKYSNAIGYLAGYVATGSYNQYIGHSAGRGISGDYNIEIQTYRNGDSIIGDNSNKLHIEHTIIGDTDSKKLAIGNVGAGNLDPDATLEIIPKATSDVGLIVQRNGGSADLTV